MTNHFIDLKDLERQKISVSGSFAAAELDFAGDNIRQIEPLDWNATAERAGAEIRITGDFHTKVETACFRCLEPAPTEVSKAYDLYFRQQDEFMFDEDDEIELSEKDTRTAFFSGTQLAIGDILHEQVLLALPMKLLCTVDCKGLCPTCGMNLNTKNCNCPQERFNPNIETLLGLKERLKDRSS